MNNEHVLLIGNGPSGESHTLETVRDLSGEYDRIARCNHFYVGENFGTAVDDLFFAVANETLYAGIYNAIASGQRQVKRLMTPMPSTTLKALTFLPVQRVNFWRYLLEDEYFASIYMRGSKQKLPTMGMQALHYYLSQGVTRFTVVGIDFYSTSHRYAFSEEVIRRGLGDFDVIGYEDKAHSRQDDFVYFMHLAKKHQFEVNVLSALPPWLELRKATEMWGCAGACIRLLSEEKASK